jgi:hypothetical protein
MEHIRQLAIEDKIVKPCFSESESTLYRGTMGDVVIATRSESHNRINRTSTKWPAKKYIEFVIHILTFTWKLSLTVACLHCKDMENMKQ